MEQGTLVRSSVPSLFHAKLEVILFFLLVILPSLPFPFFLFLDFMMGLKSRSLYVGQVLLLSCTYTAFAIVVV